MKVTDKFLKFYYIVKINFLLDLTINYFLSSKHFSQVCYQFHTNSWGPMHILESYTGLAEKTTEPTTETMNVALKTIDMHNIENE